MAGLEMSLGSPSVSTGEHLDIAVRGREESRRLCTYTLSTWWIVVSFTEKQETGGRGSQEFSVFCFLFFFW